MAENTGTCTAAEEARKAAERAAKEAAEREAKAAEQQRDVLRANAKTLKSFYGDLNDYILQLKAYRTQTYDFPDELFITWMGAARNDIHYSCTGEIPDSVRDYITSYINEMDSLRDSVNSARTALINATYGDSTADDLKRALNNILTTIANWCN